MEKGARSKEKGKGSKEKRSKGVKTERSREQGGKM